MRVLAVTMLCIPLMGMATCQVSKEEVYAKMASMEPEYRAEKGIGAGVPLTPEQEKELEARAQVVVEREVAARKERLVGGAIGAVARFSSGDVIGGILALIGLGATGYTAFKKSKVVVA